VAITVSRLCADRTLGLTVVAGAAGADRMISWAHTSELADPTPWLEGGELLMTLALNLDPHPAGQFAYVERLARAGVAALAVDTGMIHPVVPPGLLTAGESLGLPVLAVPAATPFLAISRAVISAVTAAQIRTFQQTPKDQERLASAALLTGKSGVVETLAKVLNGSVLLLDAKGRTLVSAGTDRVLLSTRVANRLQAYAARHPGGGRQVGFTHVDDAGHLVVHALDAPTSTRGYLALGTAEALTSSQRLIISHAITLLSIVLDRPVQLRRTETRLRRAVFRSLLRQGADADLGLVKFFGFNRTAPVSVSVIVTSGAPGVAESIVVDILEEHQVPFLTTALADGIAILLPADVIDERTAELQEHFHRTQGRRVSAGVGKPVDLTRAIESLRQARVAARVGMTEPGRKVGFAELDVFEVLLGTQPRDTLEAIASAVLHPLETLGGAELLRTTAEFLLRNGHWESTAAALGVHRHTLRNRIDRISALLGRDLSAAPARAEIWMALKARELLSMSGSDTSPWFGVDESEPGESDQSATLSADVHKGGLGGWAG
jgi:purine catabolism regulator